MDDKPLSNRQQKTRLAFMNAFMRLILEKPFAQITVTAIANEANYGRWAFYQYFDSKEAVAWAAFVHWMTHLDNMLIAVVKHLESPYREYESWRMIFRAFEQQKHIFARMDSSVIPEWHLRAKELLVQQFFEHLQNGNFALMAGVRPEIAARLYVAALMEMLEQWGRNPDLGDSDRLVDEFFVFIFNQPPPKSAQK